MLPALLTTLLWASSSVLANRGAQLVGARAANFARLCLAGALLAIWAHGFGRGLGGGGFWWLVLSGLVGIGCGDVAFFTSLPLLGSRLTVLVVQCLSAPLAAWFEWLWLGTTLSPAQLGLGGAILGGVALAIAPEHAPHPDPDNAARDRALRRRGLVAATVAAFGQAGGAVLTRRAYVTVGGAEIDGGSAAYQRVLGGLVVVSIAFFFFRGRPRLGQAPRWREARPWLIANALVGPGLGVTCFQWALRTAPTALVMPIVATTPLAVIPLAYLLEGERPGARSLLGGLIAVAGAAGLAMLKG